MSTVERPPSDRPLLDRPLAPHELNQVQGPCRVAGRLLEQRGTALLLGAAHAQCWVELRANATGAADRGDELEPGQWLVLEGSVVDGRLLQARVVSWHAGHLRSEGERARLERSAAALGVVDKARQWVRSYFEARDFVEVCTPVRVAAPDPSVYIAPHATTDGWLITSPEFHMKRLLVGGLPRVYQFASCTREGEVGTWHQPEFRMLEWYRAFQSMDSVMADTEAIVTGLCTRFGSRADSTVVHAGVQVRVEAPFERLTVREAFRRFAAIDDAVVLAERDEDRYFQLFVDQVEPALRGFSRPVFVTEYPRSQAALAQACAHDPSVAERFELYIAGVELCNGYGELTDPREQRLRFERDLQQRQARGLPAVPIDHDFIAALVEGMPPAAGNALGFERLMALVLEVPLSAVVAFPKTSP